MKFFDKIKNIAEEAVKDVEESAKSLKKSFEEQGGTEGLLNKTSEQLDKAGKKTKVYLDSLAESNKKILDEQSNKLKATSEVIINTAQKITDDVITQAKNAMNNLKEETKDPKETKSKTSTPNKISDLEYATLDSTPLEIILESLGGVKVENTNSWVIGDNKFNLKDNHWLHVSSNVASKGAISLVGLISLIDDNKVPNYKDMTDNYNLATKYISDLQKKPEYSNKLSAWAKNINPVVTSEDVKTTPVRKSRAKPKATTEKTEPKAVKKAKPIAKESKAKETKKKPKP